MREPFTKSLRKPGNATAWERFNLHGDFDFLNEWRVAEGAEKNR